MSYYFSTELTMRMLRAASYMMYLYNVMLIYLRYAATYVMCMTATALYHIKLWWEKTETTKQGYVHSTAKTTSSVFDDLDNESEQLLQNLDNPKED